MQFVLLATLWWLQDHGGSLPSQARLAEQAGTDPMMTSQVVRKLQTRGLLKRATDPDDSRARSLQLTAPGRRLATRALADVEAADERYFAALGEDIRGFTQALATLNNTHGIDHA